MDARSQLAAVLAAALLLGGCPAGDTDHGGADDGNVVADPLDTTGTISQAEDVASEVEQADSLPSGDVDAAEGVLDDLAEFGPDVAAEVTATEVNAEPEPETVGSDAPAVGTDAPPAVDADAAPEDAGPAPDAFDPESITEEVDAFPFGVQAADATPASALLWTKVAIKVEGLHVVVYAADGAVVADVPATVADGGFVVEDVAGLEPWTDYWYTFVAEEPAGGDAAIRSEIGRFRTAPAADAQPALVFGATSCNDKGLLSPTPLGPAADAQLDLFLMAGDTVYADGSDSVADYRAVWEDSYLDDDMRAVHASTSFLYTWDDHEVQNNWNPETLSASKIANARQVFYEHAPVRTPPDAPLQLWRSYEWGKTAEFFVLDARGERKPSTMDTDAAEYLSVDQMAWLQAGLLASEATFKIILHGVAFTDMPWQYPSASDRWEGYNAQRVQLLDTLEEVDGVMFITGDFHFGAIATIEPAGKLLDFVPEVLVGPVAQFGNPGMYLLSLEPQFSHLTLTNNYTRFTADPMADPPEVTIEFIAGDGDVFHAESLYF